MNLRDRVKAAMDHKGCDIPSLAKAAGVKPPSVHDWLNGKTAALKAGPAIKAAKFLGVLPLWLAEGEGPMLDRRSIRESESLSVVVDAWPLLPSLIQEQWAETATKYLQSAKQSA